MAKDAHDKSTADLLTPPKRGRGRPNQYGFKSTSADRMVRAREKIKQELEDQLKLDSTQWDERTCLVVMNNKDNKKQKEAAWLQFGVINKYCHSDENY